MNKMIKININENYEQKIALKKLLLLNVPCWACDLEEVDLQINIKKNVCLNLLDDIFFKSKIKFVLNKDSKLEYFSNPDNSSDKELRFELAGNGAEAKVKILCLGQKDQNFSFKTIQDHKVANTKSNLIIKGVFDDNSQLKSDNLIKVAQNAQNVSANQINKNILIGEKSRVITIPKLEIKADKVKCHHGAAVSKLDENQLFYLQSRGFDLNESKNMLITAFLN